MCPWWGYKAVCFHSDVHTYRYGVEAGELTDDSLATAGHVADLTGVSFHVNAIQCIQSLCVCPLPRHTGAGRLGESSFLVRLVK